MNFQVAIAQSSRQNKFETSKQNPEEMKIIKKLSSYPDIIKKSAEKYEPHLLTNYMRELAQEIHSYYNKFQILVDDSKLRNARLALIEASRYVLKNSGRIIGINMPDKM